MNVQSYKTQCSFSCGKREDNNCAHYVSNALIKAGLKGIDGGKGKLHRTEKGMVVCEHGRPIRAKELRDWFAKHGKNQLL